LRVSFVCLDPRNLLKGFTKSNNALSKHAICLCDDDKDVKMVHLRVSMLSCPGVSSESMADAIRAHPDQVMLMDDLEDT
jgi:hypothetical protein